MLLVSLFIEEDLISNQYQHQYNYQAIMNFNLSLVTSVKHNIYVTYHNRPPEGSMIMLSRSSGVVRLYTQKEGILVHQVTQLHVGVI